ncbi:MAG: hypothetical protein J6X34_11080, partial [Clostridia bacterium]|nr:hypothetical protein [Clostridia bacterium]
MPRGILSAITANILSSTENFAEISASSTIFELILPQAVSFSTVWGFRSHLKGRFLAAHYDRLNKGAIRG